MLTDTRISFEIFEIHLHNLDEGNTAGLLRFWAPLMTADFLWGLMMPPGMEVKLD